MGTLGHKIIGNGEKKVLFLHELMGDCRNYASIIPYLDTENFTYYFVDLRGYGLSRSIEGSYTLDEASHDIKEFITHFHLKEVTLVAHSMSTMIAQKIALMCRDIHALILITPIPASGVKVSPIQKQALLKQASEDKNFIEEIVKSSSKRYNQGWIEYRIQMGYSSSHTQARVGYMNMYMSTNFLEEAKNISIPIFVLVGKHDFPVFALDSIQTLFSQTFKNFTIVESLEAGHYPMIETPVFFASLIEKWANSLHK